MQLLVEESVDERLPIAFVHCAVDANDAALEIDVPVIAHPVVDDPAPRLGLPHAFCRGASAGRRCGAPARDGASSLRFCPGQGAHSLFEPSRTNECPAPGRSYGSRSLYNRRDGWTHANGP